MGGQFYHPARRIAKAKNFGEKIQTAAAIASE
jgi:hypothetical protein